MFGPSSPTWKQFRDAPAAKRYHQAYRHGLLEHSLTVAQAVSAISATFPGIDRDVAVTGALLHDIGKLEAYTADPLAIDMTDLGKLQGEIPLGYYRIRRLIEDLPGFPDQLAAAVLHIILSHHGQLEHGSPVVPVHARGHARAHDRQPRRPPRLVRPAREGAARRLPLVPVRPGALRLRLVLRAPRGVASPSGRPRIRCATCAAARATRAASSARASSGTSAAGNVSATEAAGWPAWSRTATATDANPGVTEPSSCA